MIDPDKLTKLYQIITPSRWSVYPDQNSQTSWNQFRSHPAPDAFITDFLNQSKRFFIVNSGRRAFKTETTIRLLVWFGCQHDQQNLVIAGPTIEHTKGIVWESLKKLVPPWAVQKIYEEGLEIKLINGSSIRVTGLDVPERIRGRRLNGIVIEEMGYVKDGIWTDIKPGLNDTQGWCIMAGTPNGKRGDFYDLYMMVKNDPAKFADEYGLYHWTTAQVRGAEFVESDRISLSPTRFQQEDEGLFVSSEGRAYYPFDLAKHVDPTNSLRHRIDLPIDICADFNVNIMPWPVCQSTADLTMVLDEVVGKDCSIEHMANLVKSQMSALWGDSYRAQTQLLRWYGDATAQERRDPSAHAASWSILKDQFRDWNVEWKVGRHNPPVGDRIELVNARLMTADRMIHCRINAKAQQLILDLEQISRDDLKDNKKKMGERSHASDAFGYMVWHQYKTNYRTSNVRNIPL